MKLLLIFSLLVGLSTAQASYHATYEYGVGTSKMLLKDASYFSPAIKKLMRSIVNKVRKNVGVSKPMFIEQAACRDTSSLFRGISQDLVPFSSKFIASYIECEVKVRFETEEADMTLSTHEAVEEYARFSSAVAPLIEENYGY